MHVDEVVDVKGVGEGTGLEAIEFGDIRTGGVVERCLGLEEMKNVLERLMYPGVRDMGGAADVDEMEVVFPFGVDGRPGNDAEKELGKDVVDEGRKVRIGRYAVRVCV